MLVQSVNGIRFGSFLQTVSRKGGDGLYHRRKNRERLFKKRPNWLVVLSLIVPNVLGSRRNSLYLPLLLIDRTGAVFTISLNLSCVPNLYFTDTSAMETLLFQ